MHQRALKEREADELHDALSEIDSEAITAKKRMDKKHTLLREQINIRKKVLNQTIKIHMTENRRQRPLRDIINDLTDYIQENEVQLLSQ